MGFKIPVFQAWEVMERGLGAGMVIENTSDGFMTWARVFYWLFSIITVYRHNSVRSVVSVHFVSWTVSYEGAFKKFVAWHS